MSKSSDFFDKVYEVVKQIPYGRATSYGAIAKHLGAARSSRMVGYAMNASHSMPDVPAHRVVNRNGMLTGKHHFPGINVMQQLLESENIKVQNDQIVDFNNVFWDPKIELREPFDFDVQRVSSSNTDFVHLVKLLDADLAIRDGKDHDFYHQFNGLENLNKALVGYINSEPAACGAFKKFDNQRVEIKRMYTIEAFRGKGLASQILAHLEQWAKELGYTHCILETGKMQPEAIALYKKQGYKSIANYGPYKNVATSVCFRKSL